MMGLFNRKTKKKLEFSEYANYKGKDQKKRASLLTSFDRLEYTIVQENTQEVLLKICDTVLGGKAVLANFDKLDSRDANDMLSFISGVVYATAGEIYKLDVKLFLFGRKEEFEDGSLYQYVEDSK
jgi:hypothetical protein